MTASTGTARGGLGNQQLGMALAGVALVAAILAGGFAIGQITKVQLAPVAPAAAPAPAFDHGSATWGEAAAPTFDHGTADLDAAAGAASALNRGAAWDPALNHGSANLGPIVADSAAGLNRAHYDSELGIWETTPFTMFPNGARRGYDGTESGVSQTTPLVISVPWSTAHGQSTTRPGNPGHNHAPAAPYDASPNRFEDHSHPNFSSDSSLYRARD